MVGYDGGATYGSLKRASLLVQRGARLVATNADGSYPAADGLWPGAGALLAVITTTTGAEPEIVGKPFAPLFEAGRRRGGGGRPLVVGDRLDTDIEGAARLGWDSMLVLTGVSGREDVERLGHRAHGDRGGRLRAARTGLGSPAAAALSLLVAPDGRRA